MPARPYPPSHPPLSPLFCWQSGQAQRELHSSCSRPAFTFHRARSRGWSWHRSCTRASEPIASCVYGSSIDMRSVCEARASAMRRGPLPMENRKVVVVMRHKLQPCNLSFFVNKIADYREPAGIGTVLPRRGRQPSPVGLPKPKYGNGEELQEVVRARKWTPHPSACQIWQRRTEER